MSASQALEVIRRHGSARDVQTALYYVTRGRTAMLLELARSLQPATGPDGTENGAGAVLRDRIDAVPRIDVVVSERLG